jgi:hypothetical protein
MLEEIEEKSKSDSENDLPMKKEQFRRLFDYLDNELSKNDCDHTNILTKNYLNKIGEENIENILIWLSNNGGNCDCEVLANVEELFE